MAADVEQFTQLYDRYVERIYTFVYYRVTHRETAEDLTSSVFLKALAAHKGFDGKNPQAWLYRIARNTVIDHYRTHRPNADLDTALDVRSGDDVQSRVDKRLALEQIRAELAKLPPDQQDIITLRVWDGLTHQEISAIMGKSEAACKMALSRALGALQTALPFSALLLFLTFPHHV